MIQNFVIWTTLFSGAMTVTVIRPPLATILLTTWECPSSTSSQGLTHIREMFWRVDQFVTFRESARSPTFHNPLYCTELHQAVLRPFSHMSDLVLWWVEYKLQLTRFYHVLCTVFMFFLHFQGLLCQRGAPVWPPLWPWGLWSWRSSGKRTWRWWGHEQQHQTGFLTLWHWCWELLYIVWQVSNKQSLTFGYDNLTVEHLDSTQHLLEQVIEPRMYETFGGTPKETT